MASTFTITLPEPPVLSDDLADLLRSSIPLGDMELSHTMAYIDELESQVGMLDKAIASLQLRRSGLLQSIKIHKAILSPIRRLPLEILVEIFSLVVHATSDSYAPLPVTQHAPLVAYSRLSALVCSGTGDPDVVVHDLRGPRYWGVQRRGSVDKIDEGGYNSYLAEILDAVLSESDRWRTAELHVISFFPPTYKLFQQLMGVRGLSNLETLFLEIDLDPPDQDSGFDAALWNIFAVAPQLRSLEALFWDASCWLRAPFSLPWHQLTRVCATCASNVEALSTLVELPHIVECKFAFQRIEILPVNHRTIHLPYLRSLVLQIESVSLEDEDLEVKYQNHTSLLDFLETPCLQNLTVHETANEDAILGLITRSDCAAYLTTFRFHSSLIDHNSRISVGRSFPQSSVPAFVQAFSKEWRAMQATFPSRQSLYVQMVDGKLDEEEANDLTLILASMHQVDLFITVLSKPHLPSIILDDFHY
ncbi:F-box domain-containing protein [Mycena sanguinolenta]|uniref:F-box domain-containing protein n=1 Tax=Mycena sanguinolenta TaxID=230812 RepID=A0A8H6YRX2_9AGAR|nr:F-box domain-containing protein [Mycena sanguinolenta]